METYTETDGEIALIKHALAAADMFSGWQPALLCQVARTAILRRYERGESVGAGLASERQALLVVSGFLEVTQITSRGRRFLLRILGPGQATGLVRMFGDPPLDHGYFVRERATIVHLSCDDLIAALDRDPMQWKWMNKLLIDRHIDLLASVFNQLVAGASDVRIAATLERLAQLYGVNTPDDKGVLLRLRLSQDDLADMLCVSRQTVNKELRRLEVAGVIRLTYSAVTVLDRVALRQLVEAEV